MLRNDHERKGRAGAADGCSSASSLQDSRVLCDGSEGREDRGRGRAETRLHGGGQLPVDEPRPAGRSPPTNREEEYAADDDEQSMNR